MDKNTDKECIYEQTNDLGFRDIDNSKLVVRRVIVAAAQRDGVCSRLL